MGSYRLVLGAALLTAVVTATLTAALASFAIGALPQAVHRQLAAGSTSISVSGAVNAPVARKADLAVRRAMRAAFGIGADSISGARSSDPLGLSAPARRGLPATARGGRTPLAEAAAPDGIAAHAVLTAGSWPARPASGPGRAAEIIPAAVPAVVAGQLGLKPGDLLAVRDRATGARSTIRISGVFRPRDRADPYWRLTPEGAGGSTASGQFVTYGPLIVNPAAFGSAHTAARGRPAARGRLAVGGASWIVRPDTGLIGAGDLAPLAARVATADQALAQNTGLGGLQVTSGLPGLLQGIARSDVVARSLLVIGGLQLLLIAVAALTLAAALLASQREGETALLSARGGARWQLARLGGAESAVLALATVAAGALAGGWLAGRLAESGPLRNAGLRLPGTPATAWWTAGVIGLLCMALLAWPAFHPPTPAAARGRLGRPARAAAFARAGADLALVVIALVALWQLRRYQAVAASSQGSLSIDPVLTAAPVLALAAGTVALLRLLPAAARGGDWLSARSRWLGAAMASWEFSRRPVRQGATMLLVVLAAATSTLVLAQHQSWRRSVADQAAFRVGADLRVNTAAPLPLARVTAITRAPGVLAAMPVARTGDTGTGELLALTARRAAAAVLLRPDLSRLDPAQLWRRIIPPRAAGLAVPGRPARLAVNVSLSRTAAAAGPMQATLNVLDSAGASYSLPAGLLPADSRVHRLTAALQAKAVTRSLTARSPAASSPRAAVRPSGPAYPLRLTGITLSYVLPMTDAGPAALMIRGIAAAAGRTGPFAPPFATGRAIRGWVTPMSAPGLALAINVSRSPHAPPAGPQHAFAPITRPGGELLEFDLGFGADSSQPGPPTALAGTLAITARPPAGPVPVIATAAYLAAADVSVGDLVRLAFGGVNVDARIVASVSRFPTTTGAAVIADLATLQSVLTSEFAGTLPVSQWWLRTRRPALPASTDTRRQALPAGLPPGTVVISRARTATALLTDPLSGLPQQALPAIALAAAALAALGFSVSVTASVRERRTQRALLAALGVSRGAQARQLCLEQLMLSGPAAVAGLLLGAGLARLLVRAVTLTASAAAPVPPALLVIPWALAAGLAAVVATVPVLAAALTIASRPDPAAQLRAAESA